MRDVLSDLQAWLAQGKAVALATVVSTWGSAPRPAGSKMLIDQDGAMVGSVSAGCVEGAVVEEALGVLRTGRPRLLRYGVADDTAWQLGLACGGEIRVLVEPVSGLLAQPGAFERWAAAIAERRSAVRAVVVGGPEAMIGSSRLVDGTGADGSTPPSQLTAAMEADGRELLASGSPEVRIYPQPEAEVEVFFDVDRPPPLLVIVGAVHIGVALCRLAKAAGYRVVVIDPRRGFNTAERLPEADDRLILWPDEALDSLGVTDGTAVAILSHDPKIDDPAVIAALRSPAFYVGALGSKRTNRLRHERLLEAGLTEEELGRLYAPIGLDIGGRAPEEIALSILAQIVGVRSGSELGLRSTNN
ncbi:MAG: XdhC family protein [Anaerolineales bacterium]|nr:XdhC family protein [Anaerolineales bacterium]